MAPSEARPTLLPLTQPSHPPSNNNMISGSKFQDSMLSGVAHGALVGREEGAPMAPLWCPQRSSHPQGAPCSQGKSERNGERMGCEWGVSRVARRHAPKGTGLTTPIHSPMPFISLTLGPQPMIEG